MSKAFTKEDAQEQPLFVPARAPLPAGVPNYVTAYGLTLLQDERAEWRAEKARLEAASSDNDARRQELAAISKRLADLDARLASATVVDLGNQPKDEVRFGARVTVLTDNGEERRYQIVGVDEADASQGKVSFLSPIARAMMGHGVGDTAKLSIARGEETLEIIAIDY